MKPRKDMYEFDKRIESWEKKIRKSGISEKNIELILRFKNHCHILNNSKSRVLRYMVTLRQLALFFEKDFDKVNKQDVEKVVGIINSTQKWAPATKHAIKIMLKRFYKWLYGKDEEYPMEVKWIKSRIKATEKKLPGDGELITQEDVNKAIEQATNLRDKAFISTIYESGCRIGELSSIRIQDVEFDQSGTVICVHGKTGPRKIRLVSSTPYLANWLNSHPGRDDNKNSLWVCIAANQGKPMDYDTFSRILKIYFKKAGVQKRTNPHIFRHSRATYLANYLTEFQMNQYFGWVQGSEMPSIYVHMSGKEIDDTILGLHGMKKKKVEKPIVPARKCQRCDTINSSEVVYCGKCGAIIDSVEAMKLDEKQKEQDMFEKFSKQILAKMIERKPEIMSEFMQELKMTTLVR